MTVHDPTVIDRTVKPSFRGYTSSVRSGASQDLRQRIHTYLASSGLSDRDPSGFCDEQIAALADQIVANCGGDTPATRCRNAFHMATRQLELHAAGSVRSVVPLEEHRAMNPAPAVRLAAPLRLRWWVLKAFYPASASLGSVDPVSQ